MKETLIESFLVQLFFEGKISEEILEQKLFRVVKPSVRKLSAKDLIKKRLSILKKQRSNLSKFEKSRGLSEGLKLEKQCLIDLLYEGKINIDFILEYLPNISGISRATQSTGKYLGKSMGSIRKTPAKLTSVGIKIASSQVGGPKTQIIEKIMNLISKTKPGSKARETLIRKIEYMKPSFSRDLLRELV